MAYYVCIAVGMADFMPDTQEYHFAENEMELRAIINDACVEFDSQEDSAPYTYDFRMPREGQTNYSQRLRIAKDTGRVLDVIGMTQEEFDRESAE